MKNYFSVKKVLILAAVICCLATATVFASGTISSYVSSSNRNEAYTEIPSSKMLSKDIGFTPKIIAGFSNGYSFKEATIVNTSGQSDAGEHLADFKGLDTYYTSADGQKVTLSSDNSSSSASVPESSNTENFSGIELKYLEQAYKFVPVDYHLTDEDKATIDNGSVVFSYGSDSVETATYQFVNWTDGSINYSLMTENTALSDKDLFAMAKELIDMK